MLSILSTPKVRRNKKKIHIKKKSLKSILGVNSAVVLSSPIKLCKLVYLRKRTRKKLIVHFFMYQLLSLPLWAQKKLKNGMWTLAYITWGFLKQSDGDLFPVPILEFILIKKTNWKDFELMFHLAVISPFSVNLQ